MPTNPSDVSKFRQQSAPTPGRIIRGRAITRKPPRRSTGQSTGAEGILVLVSFGYTEIPVAELGADILIDHFDQLTEACLRLLTACPAASGEL